MNWGHKIFLAFLFFAIFLSVLIYRTFQSKVQLVSSDYYQQELEYQQQIDKASNEKSLVNTAHIELDGSDRLLIEFPSGQKVMEAEVALYRPSDAALDRAWKVDLDDKKSYSISLDGYQSGLWEVRLEWRDSQKSYMKRRNIFLP